MTAVLDSTGESLSPEEPRNEVFIPGPRDPVSVFAAEALRNARAQYRKAAEVCASPAGTDTGDAIHDARVALRRMRTCIALFGSVMKRRPPRRVGKTLKSAFKALEESRDLDIVLKITQVHVDRLPPRRAGELSGYVEACHRNRDSSMRNVRRACGPARISAVLDAVREVEGALRDAAGTGRPAELDAPVILIREYRRLLVHGAPLETESVSESEYHAARRACKRFRYALEFLRGTLGPQADRLIADLRALQDKLGDLNDVFLAQRRIRSFSDPGEGGFAVSSSRRSNPELTRYFAVLQTDARRLGAGIPRLWGKIPCRGFRALFFASLLPPPGDGRGS